MKKNSLFAGVMIVSSGKFILMAVNFLTMVVLARLLVPSDFGIVAMCSIFLNISNVLIDSGMSGSLVYQKDIKEIDKHTLFWFNIFISVVLYGVLFFTAPLIASFYNTPILNQIIKVIGLSIVIHSCCFVQNALLTKELRYKDQMLVTILSTVVSMVVSISMACLGFGVWALIAQTLSLNVAQVVLSFVFVRYVPKKEFSFEVLKKHWNFGSKLLGASLLNIFYTNMYVQIIGKTVDVRVAGLYQQAKKLNDFPRNLIQYPMDKVFFPYIVKSNNLKDDCIKILKSTSMIIVPSLVWLSLEAENIVRIVFGDKWIEASWMVSLMFIGTIGVSLESVNRSFIKAAGNTGAILKNDLFKRIINIVVLLIALRWNVKGILVAFIINGFIGWIMNAFVFSRVVECKIWNQIKTVSLMLLISLFSFTIVIKFVPELSSSVASFVVQSTVFFAVYLVLLFPLNKKEIIDFVQAIRNKVKK